MLHISRKNVKFKVDENKRTVACYIDDPALKTMAIDFFNEHCIGFDNVQITVSGFDMLPHYSAEAHCNAEDTWDEELGKKIAYNRLKNKISFQLFNNFQKIFDTVSAKLSGFGAAANDYGTCLEKFSKYREDEIKKIIAE